MVTYFLLKGGTIRCFRMAGRYAPVAYAQITEALNQAPRPVSCAPVSCAKICGKTFTDPADHAQYVHDGGCAAIIEALASSS